MLEDPFWVAGVVAYWAEGTKSRNEIEFSNSDPCLVLLFVAWASRYLRLTPDRFTIGLHLHDGQEEGERKEYWSALTAIPTNQFRRTYIKLEGSGHRKNFLYQGTASIRVSRSSDLLHRIRGWIDVVAEPTFGVR